MCTVCWLLTQVSAPCILKRLTFILLKNVLHKHSFKKNRTRHLGLYAAQQKYLSISANSTYLSPSLHRSLCCCFHSDIALLNSCSFLPTKATLHNGATSSYRNLFLPAHTHQHKHTHLPSIKVTGHPDEADDYCAAPSLHWWSTVLYGWPDVARLLSECLAFVLLTAYSKSSKNSCVRWRSRRAHINLLCRQANFE